MANENIYGYTVEPEQLFDLLKPKAATATTAEIMQASADVAVVRLADGRVGTLPISEFYPNKKWNVGSRYPVAVLEGNSLRPTVSVSCDELIELLAAGFIPELRDQSVRVMKTARRVGIRAKIAVASTQPNVDAVGIFVGKAANRVAALSKSLCGERVDIVAYSEDLEIFIKNALGVKVDSVEIIGNAAIVKVPSHQIDAAVGGGGLNAYLAAKLVGLKISIVASEE